MTNERGDPLKVPLLDLKKQFEKIRDEVMSVAEETFDAQQFILGPKVEELEKRIAEYSHCNYAIGVSLCLFIFLGNVRKWSKSLKFQRNINWLSLRMRPRP
jgi:hypothetical protein